MRQPLEARSLCCGSLVKVTARRSKQMERPRNHVCPSCRKPFRVDARNSVPLPLPSRD